MDPRKAVPIAVVIIIAAVVIAFAGPRDGATGGSVGVLSSPSSGPIPPILPIPLTQGPGDSTITPGCVKDADCRDENECTDDWCDTSGVTGICMNTPVDCSDNNACTDDLCDPTRGCSHNPKTCYDGNPCTKDQCDPQSGCRFDPSTGGCDDGEPCTIHDQCSGGVCTGGENICGCTNGCNDGNSCTTDMCITSGLTPICQHTALVCNDANPCTDDLCNPSSGCVFIPNHVSCDDGNNCTNPDTCSSGVCQPGPDTCGGSGTACNSDANCNDGKDCTEDTCEPSGSSGVLKCAHTVLTSTPCNDGDPCTNPDTCLSGACQPGPDTCNIGECSSDADCDDSNECTDEICAPSSLAGVMKCAYTVLSGTPCDDGDSCTNPDTCLSGACQPGPNTCGTGECSSASDCALVMCKVASCQNGICQYTNLYNGAVCDDNNDCTEGDICRSGSCIGRNACECEKDSDCDDNDKNTEDSCVRNVCMHEEISSGNETAGVTGEEIPIVEYEEANLTVTLDVYPRMALYQPGERLRSVTALVKVNGEPAEGATISGRLESIEPKELVFSDEGDGAYAADIGYVIPNDEKRLIPLIVEVSAGGQEATETERLLIDVEGDFLLMVNEPTSGSEVAPGEDVTFEGEVDTKRSTDELSGVQVWLIDERTDEEYAMGGEGQVYALTNFTIPKNVRENAYFLMLARANVNGEPSETAERITLTKASELYIEFDRSQQDVRTGGIALIIRYSDEGGEPIKDSVVSARITGYPSGVVQELELVRSSEAFMGNYKRDKRDNSAEIEVDDGYGNSGKAVLPPEFFEEVGNFDIPWDLITLSGIAAATAIGAILLLRLLMGRHASHNVEVKLLLGRKAQLEDLVKKTKAQFYKRQIDEETANKQIREYEESLATINKRLAERGKVPEIHSPVPQPRSAQVNSPGNPPSA